jgi:hypothetical protein
MERGEEGEEVIHTNIYCTAMWKWDVMILRPRRRLDYLPESGSEDGTSIDLGEDEENSTSSPTGDRTSYSEASEPTMEQIYGNLSPEQVNFLQHHLVVDEEKEAAKISVLYFIITLMLMIFTAQQMSENPDGVYANVCRLAITITGCILKIVLLPFRKYCGLGGRQGYSHHLVTTSDPYARTSRMEIL